MFSQSSQFSLVVQTAVPQGWISLREYSHNDSTFIIGPKGTAYTLKVANLSQRRAMVVISVDGLCLVDGRELLEAGRGFIIEPSYTPQTISSWRIKDGTPKLQFGVLPMGYESCMDSQSNPGVIEASFFFEQANPVYQADFISQSGYALIHNSGIGWDSASSDQLVLSQFAREEVAVAQMVFQYEEHDALLHMGVEL